MTPVPGAPMFLPGGVAASPMYSPGMSSAGLSSGYGGDSMAIQRENAALQEQVRMLQQMNGNVNGGGGAASAELQAQLAEERRKLQDAGMGADAVQNELANVRAELDAEKRR